MSDRVCAGQPLIAAVYRFGWVSNRGGAVIELLVGFVVAGALGARGEGLVAAGLGIGVVLYAISCAVLWPQWACWWPWCTARRSVAAGPGKRRRVRRKCWRCGGSGLVDRWGTRLMDRRR